MTGLSFASYPCFDLKAGITTRGIACVRLSSILANRTEKAALEARQALGDPFLPQRSRQALRLLESLPDRSKASILAADQGKRLKDTEAGA